MGCGRHGDEEEQCEQSIVRSFPAISSAGSHAKGLNPKSSAKKAPAEVFFSCEPFTLTLDTALESGTEGACFRLGNKAKELRC